MGGGAVGRTLCRINRAITGVLQKAIETGGCQHTRIQQITLKPLQRVMAAMERLRSTQGFSAQIKADHLKAKLYQKGRLMAPSTTWNQHPRRRSRCTRMVVEKLAQRWRRFPEFPAITPFDVALIPPGRTAGDQGHGKPSGRNISK